MTARTIRGSRSYKRALRSHLEHAASVLWSHTTFFLSCSRVATDQPRRMELVSVNKEQRQRKRRRGFASHRHPHCCRSDSWPSLNSPRSGPPSISTLSLFYYSLLLLSLSIMAPWPSLTRAAPSSTASASPVPGPDRLGLHYCGARGGQLSLRALEGATAAAPVRALRSQRATDAALSSREEELQLWQNGGGVRLCKPASAAIDINSNIYGAAASGSSARGQLFLYSVLQGRCFELPPYSPGCVEVLEEGFASLHQCRETCQAAHKEEKRARRNSDYDVCHLPPINMFCSPPLLEERFYFSPEHADCLSFQFFAGCSSNQNNFLTYESCRNKCSKWLIKIIIYDSPSTGAFFPPSPATLSPATLSPLPSPAPQATEISSSTVVPPTPSSLPPPPPPPLSPSPGTPSQATLSPLPSPAPQATEISSTVVPPTPSSLPPPPPAPSPSPSSHPTLPISTPSHSPPPPHTTCPPLGEDFSSDLLLYVAVGLGMVSLILVVMVTAVLVYLVSVAGRCRKWPSQQVAHYCPDGLLDVVVKGELNLTGSGSMAGSEATTTDGVSSTTCSSTDPTVGAACS